jgi:uridine kinase
MARLEALRGGTADAGRDPRPLGPALNGPALVLGVAGGTGSGKTTVARALVERVGPDRIAVLTQDHYYRDLSHLSPDERAQHNFDHPAAVEESLLVEHLARLKAGLAVRVPRYDFTRHVRLTESQLVEARPVVLVEGILILALAPVRALMDIKLFVDTDADVRFIRRLQRDLEERGRSVAGVIEQWSATVRPMHLEFVEPSKRWADVIIPEGGFNTVALDLVIGRIETVVAAVDSGGRAG